MKIGDINKESIKRAVIEMDKSLKSLGIQEYNLDNFSITNEKIFNKEEEIFKSKRNYRLLSLISIILLDLGIIEKK